MPTATGNQTNMPPTVKGEPQIHVLGFCANLRIPQSIQWGNSNLLKRKTYNKSMLILPPTFAIQTANHIPDCYAKSLLIKRQNFPCKKKIIRKHKITSSTPNEAAQTNAKRRCAEYLVSIISIPTS